MADYHKLIEQLGKLDTERANPRTHDIDQLPALQIAERINAEDRTVADTVRSALSPLAAAAELFADALRRNGRIFYIGAGTSGRLGVLDAAECPPTFGTEPSRIMGLIAGGYGTLVLSQEGVEDNRRAAAEDMGRLALTEIDMVIGLAASTRTPYTLAGLEHAQEIGARTAFIVCNTLDDEAKSQPVIKNLNQLIELPVGPEVITGSTRMKSGTAQKMALNIISTTAMILLGKTLGNLMVDLQARSEKLAARSRKILMDLLEVDEYHAAELLEQAGGSVKTALTMHVRKCDRGAAEELLERHRGFLRPIVQTSTREAEK